MTRYSARKDASIHSDWERALASFSVDIDSVLETVAEERDSGIEILPPEHLVLRALRYPPSHYRVLILGQDPYPTPGHAIGLAFSVARDVYPLPKSLNNIYRELHADTGVFPPAHGDLSAWEEQGVLLLNTALTVQAGKAGSHAKIGWMPVVQSIVALLAARGEPLVAVLWGKHAERFIPDLGFVDESGVLVHSCMEYTNGAYRGVAALTSAHPSPLSAHRGFFGSKPFSRVNDLLCEYGAQPIDWNIPD